MAHALSNDEDEIIKCPICLEIFNVPKYLPCLHTFCESCLSSYIESTTIKPESKVEGTDKSMRRDKEEVTGVTEFLCPVCRTTIKSPCPDEIVKDWASHFPNNHLMLTFMDQRKLKAEVKVCDLCKADEESEIEAPAVSWCSNCNEALCKSCEKYHKKTTALKHHKIVCLGEIDKNKIQFTRQEFCDAHTDKVLEAYCVDHTTPCCLACVAIDHRKCNEVLTLQEVAKGARDRPEVKEITKNLKAFDETMTEVISSAKKNIDDMSTDKAKIKETAQKLKQDIITHIETLEARLNAELNDIDKSQVVELNSVVEEFERRKVSVNNYQRILESCLKGGISDTHFFLQVNKLQRKCTEIGDFMKSRLPSLKFIHYRMDTTEDDLVEKMLKMERLGAISFSQTQLNVTQLAANFSPEYILSACVEFREMNNFKIGNEILTCGLFLVNGGLFIVSFNGANAIFCDGNGTDQRTISVEGGSPWGAVQDNNNNTVISRPVVSTIYFADTIKKKVTGSITLQYRSCRGLAYFNEQLFCACRSSIVVLNRNGKVIKDIPINFETDHVACTLDGNLLFSVKLTNTLHCISQQGDEVFQYKHEDLRKPEGITTDGSGHVYVAGYDSSNIHQISSTGTLIRIVLTKEHGIINPFAINFDESKNKLLVTHSKNKVSIFRLCNS